MPILAPPDAYVAIEREGARLLLRREMRTPLEGLPLTDLDALRKRGEPLGPLGRTAHHEIDLGDGVRGLVKESRRGGLRGLLLGDLYFGDERFRREVRVTARAEESGLPVAPILASVSLPAALGFRRHHFIVRVVDETSDLRTLLRTPGSLAAPRSRRALLDALAAALRGLHDSGIVHGDLSLGNVLAADAGGGSPRIWFIDLDASRVSAGVDLGRRCANILRLYRSALKLGVPPSRIERARFVRAYFRRDRGEIRQAWGRFGSARLRLVLHRLAWRLGIS